MAKKRDSDKVDNLVDMVKTILSNPSSFVDNVANQIDKGSERSNIRSKGVNVKQVMEQLSPSQISELKKGLKKEGIKFDYNSESDTKTPYRTKNSYHAPFTIDLSSGSSARFELIDASTHEKAASHPGVKNTKGIVANMFSDFSKDANPEDFVLALKPDGSLDVGQRKSFKDGLFSKVNRIPVDFSNVDYVYDKDDKNYKIFDKNTGQEVPIYTSQKRSNLSEATDYGKYLGGKHILQSGSKKVIVNGSAKDFKEVSDKLKKETGEPVYLYQLDNGAYNLPFLKNDNQLTNEDIVSHRNRHLTSGGVALALRNSNTPLDLSTIKLSNPATPKGDPRSMDILVGGKTKKNVNEAISEIGGKINSTNTGAQEKNVLQKTMDILSSSNPDKTGSDTMKRVSPSKISELQNNLKTEKGFFNYNPELGVKNPAPFVIDSEWNKEKENKIKESIREVNKNLPSLPPNERNFVQRAIEPLNNLLSELSKNTGKVPPEKEKEINTQLNNSLSAIGELQKSGNSISESLLAPLDYIASSIGGLQSAVEGKGFGTSTLEYIASSLSGLKKAVDITGQGINSRPPSSSPSALSGVTGFIDNLGSVASKAGKSAAETVRNILNSPGGLAYPNMPPPNYKSKDVSNPNIVKVDATDGRGNKYTKNPDGTYFRLGERKNYTYDPKTRRFNRIESAPQPTKPATTIAERRAGRRSSTGNSPDTDNVVAGPSSTVKAVQEHLNSFFYENALQQKGYSRGADGKVYDETGKEVNIDKITDTAKNERIAEDGKFGKETEAALKIYNLANPKSQIKFDETESGLKTLSDKKSVQQIQDFYNTGTIPRYGVQKVDPLKIKQMVGQKAPEKLTVPVGDVVSPIKQETSAGRVGGALSSALNPENLQRIGGNLADTLSVANLLRESSQPLPTYQQTPDWIDYTNRIANRANQGLTSAVQSEFNRNMNTNRASGYSQIMAAAGGGGSQGAVLGALGQVNQNSADAIGKFAVADQAQRDQNLQAYGNVARAEEATNQSMFGMEYQNAVNRQSQAASMIPAVMSQIDQRNQTYNTYGPGSVYEKFTNAQIQEAEYNAELAKSMNSNYGNLFGTSITPNVKVSDRDKQLLKRISTIFGG